MPWQLSDQLTAYQLAEPEAEQVAFCVFVKTKEPRIARPPDRRAFDINTEVQALVTSDDFETNDLARERPRYLRDVLNFKDLD